MNKFKVGDRVVYKKNLAVEYFVEEVNGGLIRCKDSVAWINHSYFTYSPSYIQEMFEADYKKCYQNVLEDHELDIDDEGEYVDAKTKRAFEMYKHLLNKF